MKQTAIIETKRVPTYAQIEARKLSCARLLEGTPSPKSGVHFKFNKLTLNVPSAHNVGFNYCDHKIPPTVSGTKEALTLIETAVKSDQRLRAIEITGSGDALASKVTFEVLRKIKEAYPHLTTCVVTNGLLLPRKLPLLKELGVNALKVVVNAVDAEVGSQLYSYVRLKGITVHGIDAFEVLCLNQLDGIRKAADMGMMVEVTAIYIPGINDEHLEEVARTVRALGAYKINVAPPEPEGRFAEFPLPSSEEVELANRRCEEVYLSSDWVLNASPEVMECLFGEEAPLIFN